MNYIIREATKKDTDEIINLWYELSSFLNNQRNVEFKQEITPAKKDMRKTHYDYVFNSNNNNVFLAEVDNEIVGFIEVCINDKDANFYIDKYGYIAYFYVKSSYRIPDLMFKLYNIAEKWVVDNEIHYICSDVNGENHISRELQEKIFLLKPYQTRMAKKI